MSSTKKIIATTQAPAAIGPYSQGIAATGTAIFVSGQIPLDPVTGSVAGSSIETQARQSLSNVRAVLAAAGAGLENVVKTTVFLTDMNDFAAMNAVYAGKFSAPYPARSTIAVAGLPLGAKVEIEMIARRTQG